MALPVSHSLGIAETLHFQDSDDTFTLNRVQDVAPILDLNKAQQANGEGMSASREMRHVARVPHIVYLEWCKTHGVDVLKVEHRGLLKRLLSDPDNRWLRVDGGRI